MSRSWSTLETGITQTGRRLEGRLPPRISTAVIGFVEISIVWKIGQFFLLLIPLSVFVESSLVGGQIGGKLAEVFELIF